MIAIYNEIDPFAARWLRNLIAAGHIAPGVVDERSVSDLVPADVAGLGQRHFFAGIAGWSLALRLAGVPDTADVWTGSCPCQSLSDAGKRLGFADHRHLWPEWFRLIRECRPAVVFGEQVESGLGWSWLDLVFADMEGEGYACAAADLPAASVGAPHRRQRILFVAYSDRQSGRLLAAQRQERRNTRGGNRAGSFDDSALRSVANATGERWNRVPRDPGPRREQSESARSGEAGELGDASLTRSGRDTGAVSRAEDGGRRKRNSARRVVDLAVDASADGSVANTEGPGRGAGRLDRSHGRPTIEPVRYGNDSWTPCDWILCRDPHGGPPVARPVEPGTFPLDHGVPGRVGLIRGYGNAIVPEKVAAFIVAALEAA